MFKNDIKKSLFKEIFNIINVLIKVFIKNVRINILLIIKRM